MIRKLYYWVMKWADHPHGVRVLAFIAFIESAFFLIPPDPLLIGLAINKPRKSFQLAALTTIFSVLGGGLGYLIGYSLWELTHPFFFKYIFSKETFDLVSLKYQENAVLALFIAGFTPVPYKVFTVAAGATNLALLPFFIGSVVGRGARYFMVATLIFFLGERIRSKIETHLEIITIATTILIILFFILFKW